MSMILKRPKTMWLQIKMLNNNLHFVLHVYNYVHRNIDMTNFTMDESPVYACLYAIYSAI